MSDSPLPQSWMFEPIGNLCSLFNGRAFKQTEWSQAGLPIIRIQNLNNSESKFNYFDGELDDRHLVLPGTLLFAWSGTPGTSFGAHEWKGEMGALNQHIFKLDFSDKHIDKSFFKYAINQKLMELIGNAQGGVGLRHVTKKTFEGTKIAFPPLSEQTRIANKLDELLAQVDTIKARVDAIPAILKRFRQSVLAAAVSGKLTEEWRAQQSSLESPQELLEKIEVNRQKIWEKECLRVGRKRKYKLPDRGDYSNLPEMPEGWTWASVDSLCSKVVDGVHKKPSYQDSGVPFITVKNLTVGPGISFDNLNYVSYEDHIEFFKRANPEKNDILISKDGTLGVVRKINTDKEFSIFVSVALVKPVLTELADYMELAFASPTLQNQMIGVGTGLQHIHLTDLRKDMIPIPPLEEQKQIVQKVEQLFAFADQIEQRVKAAQSRIDNLTQSILAKAFRGELVPQDPNDEPASVLLERIKQEREEAAKLAKAVKKVEKKKVKA